MFVFMGGFQATISLWGYKSLLKDTVLGAPESLIFIIQTHLFVITRYPRISPFCQFNYSQLYEHSALTSPGIHSPANYTDTPFQTYGLLLQDGSGPKPLRRETTFLFCIMIKEMTKLPRDIIGTMTKSMPFYNQRNNFNRYLICR